MERQHNAAGDKKMATFAINIEPAKIDKNSIRYRDCDVQCELCDRPIMDRWTAKVVIVKTFGNFVRVNAEGETEFLPIDGNADFSVDPVEYGCFVGSHCARKIPREYKMTMKKACKNYNDWV